MRIALLTTLWMTGCGLDSFGAGQGPHAVDDTAGYSDTSSGDPDTSSGPDTGSQGDGVPIADAGADQTVQAGQSVNLDGSGSFDPDGDSIDYLWQIVSLPSGSGITLLNDDRVDPTFIPDGEGDFVFSLAVTDGAHWSDTDEVVITAEAPDEQPVAIAGSDQYVDVGQTVFLDGSSSFDPNGEPLSYAWTLAMSPAGSGASLSSTTASRVSFVADVAGQYSVRLVVNDGGQDSAPDDVRVTASEDSGGGSSCLGCARSARISARRRLSGMAFLAFPLLVGWRRRQP